MILKQTIPPSHSLIYSAVLAAMCTVILAALALEHVGGYLPCKLCLEQREPWYVAILVMVVATAGLMLRWPPMVFRGFLLIAGLLMIYSFYLGVFHAGVEWAWWEGPGDCGAVEGGIASDTGSFLQQLEQTVAPSCNEAALRILGLSLAGWNAVASLVLALTIFRTVFR